VDLARYSKDEYKKLLAELVQYEDFVTEVTVSKSIKGGKLPARVYQVVIMEPDAIDLKELEKMKKQQGAPKPTKPSHDETPDFGVPKK